MKPSKNHPWQRDQRIASQKKARSLTCPTCKRPNALTRYEARKHYQCANCTALEEFGA